MWRKAAQLRHSCQWNPPESPGRCKSSQDTPHRPLCCRSLGDPRAPTGTGPCQNRRCRLAAAVTEPGTNQAIFVPARRPESSGKLWPRSQRPPRPRLYQIWRALCPGLRLHPVRGADVRFHVQELSSARRRGLWQRTQFFAEVAFAHRTSCLT